MSSDTQRLLELQVNILAIISASMQKEVEDCFSRFLFNILLESVKNQSSSVLFNRQQFFSVREINATTCLFCCHSDKTTDQFINNSSLETRQELDGWLKKITSSTTDIDCVEHLLKIYDQHVIRTLRFRNVRP
jgi:hypothetical protein